MFAFLNMLFRRATLIVEDDDPLGGASKVGHNEANTGIEFARMPGLFNADTLDGWAPVWGWNKLIPSAAVV